MSAFKPISQSELEKSGSISSSSSSSVSSTSSSSSSSSKLIKNNFIDNRSAKYKIKTEFTNNENTVQSTGSGMATNGTDVQQQQQQQQAVTNQSSTAAAVAAAIAAAQMNPFYIDKIFNFQNMFLFSSANTNAIGQTSAPPTSFSNQIHGANNLYNGQNVGNFNANSNLNRNTFMGSTMSSTSIHQELSTLMQHNLMQNVYNYCNTSAMYENTFSKIKTNPNANEQNRNAPNNMKNVVNNKKNNFSIERILSLPSKDSKTTEAEAQAQPKDHLSSLNKQKNVFNSHMNMINHQLNDCRQNGSNHGLNLPSGTESFGLSSQITKNTDLSSDLNRHIKYHNSNTYSKGYQPFNQKSKRICLPTMHKLAAGTPIAITAPIPPSMASMVSSMMPTINSTPNLPKNPATINSIKQLPAKVYASFKNNDHSMGKSKNAKKYKCDLCGRGFSRSNTLITHRVGIFYLPPSSKFQGKLHFYLPFSVFDCDKHLRSKNGNQIK